MNPKFWVVNTLIVALLFILWQLGVLTFLTQIPLIQLKLMLVLGAIAALGFIGAFLGYWKAVLHLANGLPILGLVFTGLGIVDAGVSFHAVTEAASLAVFRSIVLSLAVNFEGVLLYWWLRELAYWVGGEHI